jgi:MFS family permease
MNMSTDHRQPVCPSSVGSPSGTVFNRAMVGMLGMVVLVGLGEKMAERFLPLYLGALGATPFLMGALNGFDNILSALYSYPGGWLSDRFGYRRALIFFTLLACGGYLIVILVPAWWAVFVGSLFFISWTAISLPAVMSLINRSVPKNRRVMGVTLHSLTRRLPMALGPVLGGLIIGSLGITAGVRAAFIVALVLALVAIGLMLALVKDDPAEALHPPPPLRESLRRFSPNLWTLLVADTLIRFAEQLPYAFLAVWVCNHLRQSELAFGWLTALEMAVALLVYLPVAWLADRGSKKTYVVITFSFFALFPAVLYLAGTIPGWFDMPGLTLPLLAVAFVVRGLKEFGEPTRKSMILDLAPEEAKAATFGAYYLLRDIVVGSVAFSSGWLWGISPGWNLAIATACGLAGTLFFAWRGKDLA